MSDNLLTELPDPLFDPNDPFGHFLMPTALDSSPEQAFASHASRAFGIAMYFASTRSLQCIGKKIDEGKKEADENRTVAMIAHLHAASINPDFTVGGERSADLAPMILRRMNKGDGEVGTNNDYDMALKGLMTILYRYSNILSEDDVSFVLNELVPPGISGPHPPSIEFIRVPSVIVDAFTFAVGLPFLAGTDIPVVSETENHLLMIESSRYLVNQLLLDRDGSPEAFDNSKNGLKNWLLQFLQEIARHDFLEFNSRPYTRLSVHALLNLYEFARDEEIRTAAHILLDYNMAKFAVSSCRQRRVPPFRRQQHRINHARNEFNDLWAANGDPTSGLFMAYTGALDHLGRPASLPSSLAFCALLTGTASYRPPPAVYQLALERVAPPYVHRFYHGVRPRLPVAPENAEGGLEIYSKSPSFLISAGGSFLNSGYGFDELDIFVQAFEQTSRAQAVTLIPMDAHVFFSDLLRFEPFPDPLVDPYAADSKDPDTLHSKAVNTGVHDGFMCGGNLRPAEKKIFREETTEAGPALCGHGEGDGQRPYMAWKGSGNDNISVVRLHTTSLFGISGVESFETKVVLPEETKHPPALASHGGRLYLAWTGQDDQLNISFSEDHGVTFKGKFTFSEISPFGPALVSHAGRLLISWTGEGDQNLNIAAVAMDETSGFSITGLTGKLVLPDTSDAAPALASTRGRLFTAWKGSGNNNISLAFSALGNITFAGKQIFEETSPFGPALATKGEELFLGWTGEGAGLLNVAAIPMMGAGANFQIGAPNKVVINERTDAAKSLCVAQGKLFAAWKGKDNEFLNVFLSADGLFAPEHWHIHQTGLGFHVAAYRAPVVGEAENGLPVNFAAVHVCEASAMDFETFKQRTLDRNAGMPDAFTYGGRFDFFTADDRHFRFLVKLESDKRLPRVELIGEAGASEDFTKLPLVHGPFLNSFGHEGLIEIRSPSCDVPIVLDYRDAVAPDRVDNARACPQPWIDRAAALMGTAFELAANDRPREANMAQLAAAAITILLDADPPKPLADDFISGMLALLGAAGIDFSMPEDELRDVLVNPAFTPYPALAAAMLEMLTPHGLINPVFLDVVRAFYEDGFGAPSPRHLTDIRSGVLRSAILAASNERHQTALTDFTQLDRS